MGYRETPMQHQTSQYDRYGLAISTASADAADAYIWGLDLALSGGLGADEHFRSATEADEGFALAHAALATVEQRLRRPESARSSLRRARELAGGTTRRERQHIAVIAEAMEATRSARWRWPRSTWMSFQATLTSCSTT